MHADATLKEISARLMLARGTATLLLAVVNDDERLDDVRRLLMQVLAAENLRPHDMGVTAAESGPTAWVQATQREAAGVMLASVAPRTDLAIDAFAQLVNAQREALRDLAAPVFLVLSQRVEKKLRQTAPDFVTWIAQTYKLPPLDQLQRVAASRGIAPAAALASSNVAPIRFLHISDLHLRPSATKRHDQDRVLNGLLRMLTAQRASAALDLIFVTGDLAQSGKDVEYEVVVAFLRDLLAATGVEAERLFVVPGNHDVDRDTGRWLLRTLQSDSDATDFFVVPAHRRWHTQKFDAWGRAMKGLLGDDRALGLAVGADAVEYANVRGTRIAVASFNTAWFAQDEYDREKLWIGEANVAEAARYASQCVLSVALMHHPTDDLAVIEHTHVDNHLEQSFDLVLRGHLHKERTRVTQGARGTSLSIAAPATYQGSQWQNGCFIGEVRPDARTVRLQPFTFGSGADPWVLDAKVFPDDADDGYRHTYRLGERRPTTALESAASASAADAYWALERKDRLAIARRLGVQGATHRDIEAKVALLVQDSPEGVDVWRILAGRASGSNDVSLAALSVRFAEEVSRSLGHAKIPRSDPQFVQRALEHIATAWQRDANGAIRRVMLGQDSGAWRLVGDLLDAIVEGPLKQQVEIITEGQRVRADYVLGRDDEPGERRAILEMRTVNGPRADRIMVAGLEKLDLALSATGVMHGALIAVHFDAQPRFERVTSPGGRGVLVLWLPTLPTSELLGD